MKDLATILIEDNVFKDKIEPPIDAIIENFGDNMDVYLRQLGFPEEAEIDECDYNYLYNSIYDDLSAILRRNYTTNDEKFQNNSIYN